jgi:hypothetical protein
MIHTRSHAGARERNSATLLRRQVIVMTKRKRIFWIVLGSLYLFTWIGGWISHNRVLHSEAQRDWDQMAKNVEHGKMKWFTEEQLATQIHADGPSSNVEWCLPVLPGVLLADSDVSIGPRCGASSVKIILYYGFGSIEVYRFSESLA